MTGTLIMFKNENITYERECAVFIDELPKINDWYIDENEEIDQYLSEKQFNESNKKLVACTIDGCKNCACFINFMLLHEEKEKIGYYNREEVIEGMTHSCDVDEIMFLIEEISPIRDILIQKEFSTVEVREGVFKLFDIWINKSNPEESFTEKDIRKIIHYLTIQKTNIKFDVIFEFCVGYPMINITKLI